MMVESKKKILSKTLHQTIIAVKLLPTPWQHQSYSQKSGRKFRWVRSQSSSTRPFNDLSNNPTNKSSKPSDKSMKRTDPSKVIFDSNK